MDATYKLIVPQAQLDVELRPDISTFDMERTDSVATILNKGHGWLTGAESWLKRNFFHKLAWVVNSADNAISHCQGLRPRFFILYAAFFEA